MWRIVPLLIMAGASAPTGWRVPDPSQLLVIDTSRGRVHEDSQEPRFFLRAANWLHLNRGKKAWTYIADAYATGLLVLSLTGLWMFPGRKGLLGRAGLIAMAGALVPALYVTLSGGP